MRVLLWIIGIPLLLIVGVAVMLPLLLDEKDLIELVAAKVEESTGVVVEVKGESAFALFPKVSISAGDVSVDVPDSKTQLRAETISAGVALMPLFRRSVEIDSILVEGLTAVTEAADDDAAKTAAFDTSAMSDAELDAYYEARAKLRVQAQADAAAAALAAPMALEVGELVLRDINITTVDSSGESISELLVKQMTAYDLNVDGRPAPLTAHIILASDGENSEIKLAGDVVSNLETETLTLDGMEIAITGASVEPITALLQGTVYLDKQVAEMELKLQSGEMTGDGRLRYATFESPQIDAELAITELNPALLILAGPEAVEEVPTSDDTTSLPLHTLRMIDTRASLRIDTVVLDPHTLNNVNAELRVVDGVAILSPVTADVYGGKVDFAVELDGHYNNANLKTSGSVQNFDIAQAVAATAPAVAASGTAALDWNLSATGRDSDALSQSLQGPITLQTESVTLENLSVENMLCQGVALVNQESITAELATHTQFTALYADIQLSDGVAELEPLRAELNAVSLSGNGSLNLLSQDLRASLRAQLAPGLEELDPACRVNERLLDIRWPMECKGNLADDPASWCGINTSEIVRDLAEDEVKRKVSEEAGRLFNRLFDKKKSGQTDG